MAQELERPLILNESIKDSIDQPPPNDFPRKVRGPPNSINSVVEEEEPIITPIVRVGKRWRVAQVCGGILLLIGFVFIFALPPFIQSEIVELAKEQVIMTPDNEQLWGHFPGKSESIILRNFTFFALQNEEDFLLHNQKPAFTEVSGFKIQELEDFINITYLDNGNKVKAKDWIRFAEWFESRDLDEKVSILNMGSLGYWSTLKQARPTLLLQQGLALLFTNMEESILPTVLGQGISQQFLPNFTAAYYSLLAPVAIDSQNAQFIWQQPAYGLSDKNNVGFWAQAAEECFTGDDFEYSSDAILLKNYFTLSDRQTEFMMRQLHAYVSVLKELLLQNHYCDSVPMEECTGRYLSVGQLASGAVTYDTPPVSSIEPALSICDSNATCTDKYPELFAFYQKEYVGPKGLTFDREMVLGWFNYNNSQDAKRNYTTAENCLLHIGNLDQLWEWGTAFDKDQDETYLELMGDRFKLPTKQHTHVFWEWLKYLTHKFVLQEAGNAKLGISTLFAQGFYQQLSLLIDNLQPFLLSRLLQKELLKQECHLFFQTSLDENNPSLINSLCKQYPDIHSLDFATNMLNVCEKKFGLEWDKLVELGVGLVSLENHCDPEGPENGLGSILHKSKVMLDGLYKCNTTPYPYCSNFELALLQWNSAAVTSNPPEALKEDLPAATSFADWFTGIKPFEYWDFMHKFSKKERENFPIFSMQELFKMFNFEGWLSSSVVLSKLAENSFVEYLLKYIRWICIQITLGGYTTRRTPREILFGYEDEFLAQVKNAYPPFGGDPSAPSFIAFNELNFTASETNLDVVFATGKDDFRKVYQYQQIYGYNYLVNNYSWFDGNQTQWEWRSPWAEKDYFYGTTAKIFAPNQFEANNMSLLITQVQRYGSNSFYDDTIKTERYGIDLYKSFLNQYIGEVAPHNDKYYQTIPNVFNVSSIYGLPLYVTKNHFMNCTEWLELVDIYDEHKTIKYEQISQWDDTFILVEPYTGVSFQSVIYLQNNYYHQQDELYAYPVDSFLPIFSIFRGGNLTETKFHELYDPLVMALDAKGTVVIVGIVMAVVGLALGVFATYRRKVLSKKVEEVKKSELGISLQKYEDEDDDEEEKREEEKKEGEKEEKGL